MLLFPDAILLLVFPVELDDVVDIFLTILRKICPLTEMNQSDIKSRIKLYCILQIFPYIIVF